MFSLLWLLTKNGDFNKASDEDGAVTRNGDINFSSFDLLKIVYVSPKDITSSENMGYFDWTKLRFGV